jgi:hypothetical protein
MQQSLYPELLEPAKDEPVELPDSFPPELLSVIASSMLDMVR